MRSTATSAERRSADSVWQVEEPCPQCGGAVALDEGDRLLICPYCRVRLILGTEGCFRYCLPPRRQNAEQLLFVPYWRLKGQLYDCVPYEVRHSVVDRTVRASTIPGLPRTLGLRPQAMKLHLARGGLGARYLRPESTLPEAVEQCHRDLRDLEDAMVFYQTFLGRTVSLLYLPVEIRDGVYDAVLDRRIAALPAEGIDLGSRLERADQVGIRYLPALCPHCGGDLAGERDSAVLHCANCVTVWAVRGDRLEPVRCGIVRSERRPEAYLPFWRVRARIEGCRLETYADLIHFANLPKVPSPELERAPVFFWLPGFKIHPDHFLRLSRTLLIAQSEDEVEPALPGPLAYPVTLTLQEGGAALQILLAELAQPKPPFFSTMKAVRHEIVESTLVYIPFEGSGGELTHPRLPVTIARNLLAYGRGL